MREKSCGAVVFTETGNGTGYILVKNKGGNIGFPKGHTEEGESETETAAREILEETNTKVSFISGFRREYSYRLPSGADKTAVYFLAQAENAPSLNPRDDVNRLWTAGYEEALELLSFSKEREILEAARAFLLGSGRMTEKRRKGSE